MQPACWSQVRMAGKAVDDGEGYTWVQGGRPHSGVCRAVSGQATYRLSSKQRGHGGGGGSMLSLPLFQYLPL